MVKDVDNFFGQDDMIPFCKFCFAKKYKMSAINIAECVQIVPDFMATGL